MMSLFEIRRIPHVLISLLTLASVALLQGCFWESDDDPAPSYSIGGSISNLSTSGLVLQNNGGDDLTITSGTSSFEFATAVTNGGAYTVTVSSQPTGGDCAVSNGSGNVSGGAVTDISVICDVDPTGYYDTGTIEELPEYGNFQGLIQNNRIMFYDMNGTNELAYDGTMTVTGDSYTATVSVYKDGVLVTDSAKIDGTITEGSSLTGTISDSGSYNGTLKLDFADNNDDSADTARLATTPWDMNSVVVHAAGLTITMDSNGTVTNFDVSASTGFLQNCTLVSGAAAEINGTNLYSFTVKLDTCDDSVARGTYTGLATTKTIVDPNDGLELQFSNGLRIVTGEYD